MVLVLNCSLLKWNEKLPYFGKKQDKMLNVYKKNFQTNESNKNIGKFVM